MNKKIIIIILIVLLLSVFYFYLRYNKNKSIKVDDKNLLHNKNKRINTDIHTINKLTNKNIDIEIKKKLENIDINNNINNTSKWEYNKWILPSEKEKYNCFKIIDKNAAVWDDKGINIVNKVKIDNNIPIEIPNIGFSAINNSENSWLFNPIMGNINYN